MIQGQFAVPSKINIVQLLNSIGESDRYINDHRDKYHYVIHCINEGAVLNRNTTDGYVNLSMLALREFLGSRYADRVVKELLTWGIIECDGKAKEGVKCFGYRIHSDYISKTILIDVFKDEVMGRKLRLRKAQYQQKHKKDSRWKDLNKFGIRYREALEFIEARRIKDLTEQLQEVASIKAIYTTDLESIRKIVNQEFFLEQPDPLSRVYTNLSNLSSDLRQFLYHRKEKNNLVNLDIANSQPYLFSLLLMEHYRNQQVPADVHKYIQLTAQGKFYEYLMDKLNVPLGERKCFKIKFFGKIFYCSSYYSRRTSEGRFFAREFPNVATIVEHYKEEGRKHYQEKAFKYLSITMQRQEAQIILRTIGSSLEKKKIWHATIHDSVVCLEEHAEEVKALILEAFMRDVGIPPTVKAERLCEGR